MIRRIWQIPALYNLFSLFLMRVWISTWIWYHLVVRVGKDLRKQVHQTTGWNKQKELLTNCSDTDQSQHNFGRIFMRWFLRWERGRRITSQLFSLGRPGRIDRDQSLGTPAGLMENHVVKNLKTGLSAAPFFLIFWGEMRLLKKNHKFNCHVTVWPPRW